MRASAESNGGGADDDAAQVMGDGRHARHVTLKDVAELAGVSVSTVSLVMNEKKDARIAVKTQERVNRAIRELHYRPNALAQNLVTGTSKFIGLLTDSIATTPFAGQIIHGAQDRAWKQGYVLLIVNTEGNEDIERQAIRMFLEYKVHGILYSTWYHHEITLPQSLKDMNTVLVNCYSDTENLISVVPDEFNGGRTAAKMLLERGHRRVAFINTTVESPARTGRLAGYRRALAEQGIAEDPSLIVDAEPTQEGGRAVAEVIRASGATGVCCHNDRVAMGLYDALRNRGIMVPSDISVVGFDDQEVIAAHMLPPLSTVALPHYELGASGVDAVLAPPVHLDDHRVLIACPAVHRESISALD
ncbi:MAG: LacI family DNA-binding transcriptional regulator [Bifidobacterium psychraerophilum]|uniref:LacI family DNA-binding transcriptional regulator n=1 Tax=Bifidobacterium psychraerophilum TaxID=218140 RepID=UPI0039E7A860